MARSKLLYLGNGRKPVSVDRVDNRFERQGIKVDRRWAYNGDFPETLDGYDGIFLSGSPHGAYEDIPFIQREHDLIREAAERGIPMLGVCFGSQILASALCGRDQVFRRSRCEIGYKDLAVTDAAKNDPIASGLGQTVKLFVWHNDEVKAEHPDMVILASSDECPNQIWRYRDRPVWGIQGHPEVPLSVAPIWFEERRATMEKDGGDVDGFIGDADEMADAKTMLNRFAERVMQVSR